VLLPARQTEGQIGDGPRRKQVLAEITAASARARGVVSVAALNLETNERVSLNADRPVFMSSVVKLPIAVQLLARVDRGELSLQTRIRLEPSDLRVGGARGIASRYPNGVTMTVLALVRYAVSESDNTASDALLRYSGGPLRVTQELRALNIAGVSIDHSYAENTWRYNGVGNPPPPERWTPALFDSTVAASSPAAKARSAASFMSDPSDRATPAAMVNLLARLARGQILSARSGALLRRLMTESANPTARIVAGAPAGARVAHKTGSWGSWQGQMVALNDVGIVYRDRGSPVVIAVMISGGRALLREQERTIADVTRILMKYWPVGGRRTSSKPLKHSPEVATYVERERPPPPAQPSRDVEAQDVE